MGFAIDLARLPERVRAGLRWPVQVRRWGRRWHFRRLRSELWTQARRAVDRSVYRTAAALGGAPQQRQGLLQHRPHIHHDPRRLGWDRPSQRAHVARLLERRWVDPEQYV